MKRPNKLTVFLLAAIAFLTFVDVRQSIVIHQQRKVMIATYRDLLAAYAMLQRCAGTVDKSVLRAGR